MKSILYTYFSYFGNEELVDTFGPFHCHLKQDALKLGLALKYSVNAQDQAGK